MAFGKKKQLNPSQREQAEIEEAFRTGVTTLRDMISPSSLEIHGSYFRVGTKYARTMYVYGYPRSLYTGWISRYSPPGPSAPSSWPARRSP